MKTKDTIPASFKNPLIQDTPQKTTSTCVDALRALEFADVDAHHEGLSHEDSVREGHALLISVISHALANAWKVEVHRGE